MSEDLFTDFMEEVNKLTNEQEKDLSKLVSSLKTFESSLELTGTTNSLDCKGLKNHQGHIQDVRTKLEELVWRAGELVENLK